MQRVFAATNADAVGQIFKPCPLMPVPGLLIASVVEGAFVRVGFTRTPAQTSLKAFELDRSPSGPWVPGFLLRLLLRLAGALEELCGSLEASPKLRLGCGSGSRYRTIQYPLKGTQLSNPIVPFKGHPNGGYRARLLLHW